MANTKILQIKRTSVSGRLPNTSDTSNTTYIYPGELALNLADKRLYSAYGGIPFEIGANLTSLHVIGDVTVDSGGVISGNGAGITSVNSATVGSNTAATLRSYSDSVAATAYSNAYSVATAYANTFAANATNITNGTLDTARLPATANISTAINVGANLNLSTTFISVGNSTVNTVITSSSITGNGANIIGINATSISVGTLATARLPATANISTAINVGANLNLSTTQINIGNATVNTVITSSSITGNGANIIGINATSISVGTLDTARLPATANVTTAINVGANVNLSTTQVRVGNATVNSTITSSAITTTSNTANIGTAMYIASNGNFSLSTTPSTFKLSVLGPQVANLANSQSLIALFQTTTQNSESLEISNIRGTDGGAIGDWTTAGFRIQQKVDSTWMGYMQFNGTPSGTNPGGISFGTGTTTSNAISITERLRIAPSGNVGISNTAPDATLKVTGTANISGAVVIGGTLTAPGGITTNNNISIGNSTVNTVISQTSLTLGQAGVTTLNLTTSTTTANQVVTPASTISASTWRTVRYVVSITSGSAYQATEILVIHDGTNVYKTEYGTVYSGAALATFDADINSGSIRLLTTPINAVTTYKGHVTFIAV